VQRPDRRSGLDRLPSGLLDLRLELLAPLVRRLLRLVHAQLRGRTCALDRGLDLGLGAGGHGLCRGLRLLGTLLLLALARDRDFADIRHARCEITAVMNQDP